ncbi:uncharacterized protein LOC136087699 [Hydra vulgaris]|uniref:Uncharacterized protein LOC136087699 n=1 Tax=Hydra vulgaris TaxID=6087 RepID=A0ABM4CZ11_HYDVU
MSVSDENIEILTVEILNKKFKNILLSCCYRPPTRRTEYLSNYLVHNIIEKASHEKKKNYIIGDFNLDCFQYNEKQNITKFYNHLFETETVPIINKPTRITEFSSSLIDNVLTNDCFNITLKKGIVKTDVSDHFPIFFCLGADLKTNTHGKITIKKRIYNNNNLNLFKQQLLHQDWSYINFNEDKNIIYKSFFNIFYKIYDANFPLREIILNAKDISCPWITKGIKKSSKIKQKLYVKYLKNKSDKHKNNYTAYKNLFEKLRKKAKQIYYSDLLMKLKHNSRRVWQIMKEITGKHKTSTNSMPNAIKVENKLVTDLSEIAAEFNKFFSTIGNNLSNKIPYVGNNSVDEFISSPSSTINFSNLSYYEFEIAFKSLKRNKAIGPDDINGNIIIDFFNVIKDILFKVFEASITQGSFPDPV